MPEAGELVRYYGALGNTEAVAGRSVRITVTAWTETPASWAAAAYARGQLRQLVTGSNPLPLDDAIEIRESTQATSASVVDVTVEGELAGDWESAAAVRIRAMQIVTGSFQGVFAVPVVDVEATILDLDGPSREVRYNPTIPPPQTWDETLRLSWRDAAKNLGSFLAGAMNIGGQGVAAFFRGLGWGWSLLLVAVVAVAAYFWLGGRVPAAAPAAGA